MGLLQGFAVCLWVFSLFVAAASGAVPAGVGRDTQTRTVHTQTRAVWAWLCGFGCARGGGGVWGTRVGMCRA